MRRWIEVGRRWRKERECINRYLIKDCFGSRQRRMEKKVSNDNQFTRSSSYSSSDVLVDQKEEERAYSST